GVVALLRTDGGHGVSRCRAPRQRRRQRGDVGVARSGSGARADFDLRPCRRRARGVHAENLGNPPMPLILAIEPDRRQAHQLNAVVKGRLHADLVLADSAERALKELGDRVPDLILTSALLSPTDEVVLGDRLRKLNGVAAHVQTLTIPVLAGPKPSAR